MIRVVIPPPLRTLVKIDGEVHLAIEGPTTQRAILDALEERYPVLRGTIREHETHKRRAFVRFFACSQDLSHLSQDTLVPDEVVKGIEPFMIVGAIAGG
jgi:sulfur-carrier protein